MSAVQPVIPPAREHIAAGAGLSLVVPRCEKNIGSVIQAPQSEQLIDGVRVRPFPLWPDDRGYFLEVMRSGENLVEEFPAAALQVSLTVSYPGTIKAFHYHVHQADCWTPVRGMFQVALVDLREDSPTSGRRNTLYVGELRPWQVLIPPGVAHGYKAIGSEPTVLVYVTSRFYDPTDEGRLPFDDERINYDWDIQHK